MKTTGNEMAAASAMMVEAMQAVTNTQQGHPSGSMQEGEVYNMTSGLLPCVCVAMYETVLSPQVFEENLNDGEAEFFYNVVCWDDWKKALTEASQEYLDRNVVEDLKKYGLVSIEAESIWSPKYYNYHQDELCMNITMRKDWQDIMRTKVEEWRDREDVKEYIHENWRSYSGYVNFMPESLDEILTEDNEDRQLAAFLTLAMVVEGVKMDAGDIMDEINDWYMVDFSEYDRVCVIDEYYDVEADAWELLNLWDNDLKWDMLYHDLFDKIGDPWRRTQSLSGKKDPCTTFEANSDGKRMLFWAALNHYTVEDLYEMAAA